MRDETGYDHERVETEWSVDRSTQTETSAASVPNQQTVGRERRCGGVMWRWRRVTTHPFPVLEC